MNCINVYMSLLNPNPPSNNPLFQVQNGSGETLNTVLPDVSAQPLTSAPAAPVDNKTLLSQVTYEAITIIERTKHSPSQQLQEIAKLKAKYIKSRYNIDTAGK